MNTDHLNLDVFVEWAALQTEETEDQTLALVAEVRRLRARVDTLTSELDDTAAELIGLDE